LISLCVYQNVIRVTDAEAVSMSRFLVQRDGLFLGSSSACNLVACVKLVHKLDLHNGERIVTVLCDSGTRHYSKARFSRLSLPLHLTWLLNVFRQFWSEDYLTKGRIPVDIGIIQDMLTRPFPPLSSITKI
jgi:cysteine synthase